MFVHLHVHDEKSFLDGMSRPRDLAEKAKSLGQNALAITNHGNMVSIIEHQKECQAAGIKPIIGIEVYHTEDRTIPSDQSHHLVLLAKNNVGYQNLCKIASDSSLIGKYKNYNRTDDSFLKDHGEGVIALSACLGGEIPKLLMNGQEKEAVEKVKLYKEIFDYFALEIQSNLIEDQAILNTWILQLAAKTDTPIVLTNDVHYTNEDDAYTHEILLAIQSKKTLDDDSRMRFSTNCFWLKSEDEMRNSSFWMSPLTNEYERIPDEVLNATIEETVKISDMCNFELELHQDLMPVFDIPEGYTLASYLKEKSEERLWSYLINTPGLDCKKYWDRLAYELDIINSKGFPGYFLIVADLIQYAKSVDIAIGDGRGSAAGSLVSFVLDITGLDPIEYGLMFERFLNPGRNELPDVDIDFDSNDRGKVIAYAQQKYGVDHVAQIGTVGTLAAKSVIRRVAKTLGYSTKVQDEISKAIPDVPDITLELAMEDNIVLQNLENEYPEIFESARKLEGITSNSSIHAGGIIISPKPIQEYIALMKGKDGEVVTQTTKDYIEELGMLKIDFLALKSLSIIKQTLGFAGLKYYKTLKSLHPFSDQKVYEYIQTGYTEGVFQLESSLFKSLIKKLPPRRFEDLGLLVSIGRPGPLQFVDTYASRLNGAPYELPHNSLEPILRETKGIAIYQEQIMSIVQVLAGFDLGEADELRGAISKKKLAKLAILKPKFMDACTELHSEELSNEIWDWIQPFSQYGFNRSHAFCYSVNSYFMAWLKVYYPTEFWAAILSSLATGNKKDKDDKIYTYINQARGNKVEFLPPDINESQLGFTISVVDGVKKIRFGLSAMKGVGPKAIESIIDAKKEGPFKSIEEFDDRINKRTVTRGVMKVLIMSGCFDSFWQDRHSLYNDYANIRLNRKQKTEMIDEKLQADFSTPYTTKDRAKYEKKLLNLCISDPSAWEKALDGQTLSLKATVKAIRKHSDKNLDEMAFVTIETKDEDVIEAIVFAYIFRDYTELKQGDVIQIRGEKSEGKLITKSIKYPNNNKEDASPVVHEAPSVIWNPECPF